MMEEKIELLDPKMLKAFPGKLRFIEYWALVTNRPVGWHYWLDFIWILNNLEAMRLPKGARILDAGAGNGLLQFMLASLGYTVISVDYADRDIPETVKNIFSIEQIAHQIKGSDHPYRKYIKHTRRGALTGSARLARAFIHPLKAAANLWHNTVFPSLNPFMWGESVLVKLRARRYGTIVYMTGDFTDLSMIPDGSIDCVVSVSALEHSDHQGIQKAVSQFERVLKPSGPMFLTVSAAKEADRFFEPCRGWCFCEKSLRAIFTLPGVTSNMDCYDEIFASLKRSKDVKKRIHRYYFDNGESGLPWGVYDPQYHPVGIVKVGHGGNR